MAGTGLVHHCVDGKETDRSWQGLTLFNIVVARKLIDHDKETDKSWQGLTLFTIASTAKQLIDLQAIGSHRIPTASMARKLVNHGRD